EFVAALEVDRNSQRYFPGLRRESPWRFDEVKLGRALTFRELASLSRTTPEELGRLNLAFQKPVLQNRTRIPAGTVVKVHAGSGPVLVANVSRSSVQPLAGGSTIIASSTSVSASDASDSAKTY